MEPFIFIIPIAVVIYFIINGLTKSKLKNKKSRIFNSILGAVLISPVIYFVFVVGMIFILSRENSRKFDSNEWRFGNDVDVSMSKYEMIDDLIDEEILLGKDSIKVKEILGSPSFRQIGQNSWSYDAGVGGGIGFVLHNLVVFYNSQGKVIRVEHIRIKD